MENALLSKNVPDFFFIFFFTTTFTISTILDKVFAFIVLIYNRDIPFGALFFFSTLPPLLFTFMLDSDETNWGIRHYEKGANITNLILTLIHFECIFIGYQAIKTLLEKTDTSISACSVFHLFQLSNKHLSSMKIYCFFYTVFKCIPQLFIVSVYCLVAVPKLYVKLLTEALIYNYMIIFSVTISILLPIRKKAQYFPSVSTLFLSAAFKFMAAMCACCLSLTIFTVLFKSIGYYTFILWLPRIILPVCPCHAASKSEVKGPKRILCYIMLCTIYSFIYIHPFSGKGVCLYIVFYFVKIMLDVFSLYVFSPAVSDHTILLYSLTVLLVGFVALYGLINNLYIHKLKHATNDEVPITF